MYLSDTISTLLPPGHCLYEPIPSYAKGITFGNAFAKGHYRYYIIKSNTQATFAWVLLLLCIEITRRDYLMMSLPIEAASSVTTCTM